MSTCSATNTIDREMVTSNNSKNGTPSNQVCVVNCPNDIGVGVRIIDPEHAQPTGNTRLDLLSERHVSIVRQVYILGRSTPLKGKAGSSSPAMMAPRYAAISPGVLRKPSALTTICR